MKLSFSRALLALPADGKKNKEISCSPRPPLPHVSVWCKLTDGRNEWKENNHTTMGARELEATRRQWIEVIEVENEDTTHQRTLHHLLGHLSCETKTKVLLPLSVSVFLSAVYLHSSLLPVSPLELDCGSCCLKFFGVERLLEICRPNHLLNFKQEMENEIIGWR